ncbi:MAG: hypothetical protein LBB49_05540 [Gracilibacteraceae bacterium]|jgi:hypothetical protein|nr:hypothetical protein [Gracilibacteraceae bacterium]
MSKKNGFVERMLRYGTGVISIALTCFFNIVCVVVMNVFDPQYTIVWLCDKGFYISLSAIMIQILLNTFFIRRDYQSKDPEESIIFPENKYIVYNKITEIVKQNNAEVIKVICYGTSMFGRLLVNIPRHYRYDRLEVIICSPQARIIDNERDRVNLMAAMESLFHEESVKLYISDIPPTIRASYIASKNGRPLWCSFQPYYIFDSSTVFKGDDFTPAIVADSGNLELLTELSEVFMREFARLQAASKQVDVSVLEQLVS